MSKKDDTKSDKQRIADLEEQVRLLWEVLREHDRGDMADTITCVSAECEVKPMRFR